MEINAVDGLAATTNCLSASHAVIGSALPSNSCSPRGLSVDEDGVAMQILPTLPSRYDMQKLDHSIRAELSLADPREGG
jgi:hypothetical protein